MKISTLAVFSVISLSQAYAFDISDNCDLKRDKIKDALNQKSLSIRKEEREMLRMLSPQIDQIKLDDLIQDIKDNEYGYKNEVISYSEKARRKKLIEIQEIDEHIPSDKDLSRHSELVNKSNPSDVELMELKRLDNKIQTASIFGWKKMTEAEKTELSSLNAKLAEHDKRQKSLAQAELNLNNYIRSEVLSKISTSPETEIQSDGISGVSYKLKTQNVDIEIKKDDLNQKEVSSDSFGGYYSYPLNIIYILNRAGNGNGEKKFYDIISRGKNLDISLNSSAMQGENEYNKMLKEIALNTKKTWTDFGAPILDREGAWGGRIISKEIKEIAGDVKSSLDLSTGKITVQFRTSVFNNEGNWLSYPENYVTLEEMTELLLPKECRPEVKEITNKSDKTEPKKGFFKKLFGNKKDKNQ